MEDFDPRYASKREVKPIGVRKNGKPIRVGVIDDVFIDRRIMTRILRSAGFEVLEAEDGESSLITMATESLDLVILDYMMPQMNGLQTLLEIRKRYPDVKVVMSTSESKKELTLELIKEGAIDYIIKPVDRSLVLNKLAKIVETYYS